MSHMPWELSPERRSLDWCGYLEFFRLEIRSVCPGLGVLVHDPVSSLFPQVDENQHRLTSGACWSC